MVTKLIVKKDQLESEVHYTWNGFSHKVLLKDATQDQLAILKELGMNIFDEDKKKE